MKMSCIVTYADGCDPERYDKAQLLAASDKLEELGLCPDAVMLLRIVCKYDVAISRK